MLDVLYVVGTVVFFAVMVAFVVGCERIIGARDDDCTPGDSTSRRSSPNERR